MSERVLHEWIEQGGWIRQISADGKSERCRKETGRPDSWTVWATPLQAETEEIARLAARVAELEVRERYISGLYGELIFAVARAWPGETRHEAALRYIRQAEAPRTDPDRDARAGVGNG